LTRVKTINGSWLYEALFLAQRIEVVLTVAPVRSNAGIKVAAAEILDDRGGNRLIAAQT